MSGSHQLIPCIAADSFTSRGMAGGGSSQIFTSNKRNFFSFSGSGSCGTATNKLGWFALAGIRGLRSSGVFDSLSCG